MLTAILWLGGALLSVNRSDLFKMEPLSTFSGGAWCGIELGTTTDGDVKRLYQTEKGAARPEALKLRSDVNDGIRVDLLLDGRGSKAKVTSIRILVDKGERSRRAYLGSLGNARKYYPQTRMEEWHVETFARQGILALVLGKGATERIPLIYLAKPERVDEVVATMSLKPSEIVRNKDPNADKPRVLEFGSTSVSFRLRGIAMEDQKREEREWNTALRRATASGAMRYVEGAKGSYELSIQCDYDRKRGGYLNATASISGSTVYGPLYVTSTKSQLLPKAGSLLGSGDVLYTAACMEAIIDSQNQLKRQISALGPPPVEQMREQRWREIEAVLGR